jgi:hypothetical protein
MLSPFLLPDFFVKSKIMIFMNDLSETWFIEGNIDFESKKYTLLAYLQKVNACFDVKNCIRSWRT